MNHRILLVDDEPMALHGLARALKAAADWEIVPACGGIPALELLRQESFAGLVTDLKMPGIDGIELLEHVKRAYPRMIRVVLSGDYNLRTSVAVSHLAHRVLTKPCPARDIERAVSDALEGTRLVSSAALRDAIGRIGTLPSLPRLYDELVAIAGSEHASMARAGRIIWRDPAMAAKVLQLVNSSFFGLAREVHSVEQAAAYLGMETLKALVLSAHVFSVFDCRSNSGFSMERFQHHAMATTQLVGAILAKEGVSPAARGAGITAALLHDLGQLIIASRLSAEQVEIERLTERGRSVLDAELQVLGVTHAEIGAGLLKLWGLPELIVDAVLFHHEPCEYPAERGDGYDSRLLVEVLHAADYLVDEPREDLNSSATRINSQPAAVESRLNEWRQVLRDIDGESTAA